MQVPNIDYSLHPAFQEFCHDKDNLSNPIREIVNEIENKTLSFNAKIKNETKESIDSFFEANIHELFVDLKSKYKSEISGEHRDVLIKTFDSASDNTYQMKLSESYFRKEQSNYIRPELNAAELNSFNDLNEDGISPYKIPEDDMILLRNYAKDFMVAVKEKALKNPYGRTAIGIPKRDKFWEVLNHHFAKSGFLKGASAFYGKPLSIKALGLEYSSDKQQWWRNGYADKGIPTSDAVYMHTDYDFGTVKAMVYLNDVGSKQGPFRFIKGSHKWDSVATLDYLIKRIEVEEYPLVAPKKLLDHYYRPIVNSLEGRKLFMSQPKILQKFSHFGDDLLPTMPLYNSLLSSETTFTSDIGNFIFFTGAKGIHRGGNVVEGERYGIQIILSSSFTNNQIISQSLRRYTGSILASLFGNKKLIELQDKIGQVI